MKLGKQICPQKLSKVNKQRVPHTADGITVLKKISFKNPNLKMEGNMSN